MLFLRIQEIKVAHSSIPLIKPFITSLRSATSVDCVGICVVLEDGTKGWGAASPAAMITGEGLQGIKSTIQAIIAPLLINREIEQIAALSQVIGESCVGNGSAKAGMEIALFDAYAKSLKIPLYQLLGGQTNSLQNDLTISLNETDQMVLEAKEGVKQGFTALKIKAGLDWKKDYGNLIAIREAVGSSIELRVDANQGWTRKEAVRIIHAWEDAEANVDIVEQPVRAEDFAALKFVTDNVNTPIMADESVFSPEQAMRLIHMQAVDWLNLKLMKAGGIFRVMQIADIAQAGGIPCMLGSMMESVTSVTAAAHIAAAHPNIQKIDLDAPLWLKNRSERGPFQGPAIQLTRTPGLGLPDAEI